MKNGITIDTITFGHAPETPLFENFSLQILPEQTVCIVGRSGCGKSSLLKLLAGALAPHKGFLDRNDTPIQIAKKAGGIHSISQHARLFPWFSVAKNLELAHCSTPTPVSASNEPRATDPIDKVLDFFSMHSTKSCYPSQLSGGMYQRIVLLRTLFQQPSPKLLLLDEPLSAVDRITKQEIRHKIGRTIKELQATAIRVTHDLREALYVADRIIVLGGSPVTILNDLILRQHSLTDTERRQHFTDLLTYVKNDHA